MSAFSEDVGSMSLPAWGTGAVSSVELRPIGRVRSSVTDTKLVSLSGGWAIVEVFPEFEAGLHRIGEYSHLWIMCWFHQANREKLRSAPKRVNPSLPEYGVFALRGPGRPNPISLTLVRLASVEDGRLRVHGLDAVDGTPILDIKPCNEHDSVFSPTTPYFPAVDYRLRRKWLRKQALLHHREECEWLEVGLDFALRAEGEFGHLQAPELRLTVEGPPCLLDVMQGITRARFANPARLEYDADSAWVRVVWRRGSRRFETTLPPWTVPDGAVDEVEAWQWESRSRSGTW